MLQKVEAITHRVSPDEPAYLLVEVNLTPYVWSKGGRNFRPNSYQGVRRIQIIWVNRGDHLAEFHRDLGDASLFNYPSLRIPSLWEHTVAELRDIAETVRLKDDRVMREMLAEVQSRSTLIEDSLNLVEKVHKLRRRQSSFGPVLAVQRS